MLAGKQNVPFFKMYIEREVGGRGMNYLIDFGASLFFS